MTSNLAASKNGLPILPNNDHSISMKSHKNTRHGRSLARLAALGFVAATISSCSTNPGKLDPGTHAIPPVSKSWVKVRSKPPTWYPRGVAADYPTDHHSGSWIHAEDSLGTRFFIPYHGLPPNWREALKSEALAARNPKRVRQIANEDAKDKAATVAGYIVVAPIMALGGAGGP